jgi:glycerate kinase
MRGFVLATVVGAGILLAASLEASAVPANGVAIARIGQQVDSVINARKQHVDSATNARKRQVAPNVNNRCFGAQTRDRYGYCVPNFRR